MLLNKDKIQKINLFENLTNAKVKDLIDDERLTIIVENGEIGKAIGKNGKNIKMIENMMHKKLRVIEFNNDPLIFIKNFIYPLNADEIKSDDNIIKILVKDRKTKGLLIGRNGKNLQELNNLIKNYFNLDVKII